MTTALVVDTFRESFARKIFWGFFGCSTVLMLFLMVVLNIDVVEGSLAAVKVFGTDISGPDGVPVEVIVDGVLGAFAAFLFSIGLFLAIFAAAGLIPTIFEPGRIELMLSKPLSRRALLLGKYLGTLAVIGANIAYLVAGVWLLLGWKTGYWKIELLAAGGFAVFTFAVLLCVVTLVAVASNSAVLATMVTYLVMILSSIVSQHEKIAPFFSSEGPRSIVRGLYTVLPKTLELGNSARLMMQGETIESWTPFWSSAMFGGVVLILALWIFERKDY